MNGPVRLDAPCSRAVTAKARGVGTSVVRDVMHQASRLGLPLRLQVLKANRARRLYERLGFREVAETPTHFQMMFERKSE